MELDFSKGLIPAIIIDDQSGQVLMLAYMNEESFQKTMETKETWFYSRSRQALWNKGSTSGHKQLVKSIQVDCDADTLLIRVDPMGPACHTGAPTCFYTEIPSIQGDTSTSVKRMDTDLFTELNQEILTRKGEKVDGSYTSYLFEKGIDKIGKKVFEEAGELVIAAKNQNKEEVINESCDLFYHVLVLLAEQNIQFSEVEAEMRKRFSKKGNYKGEKREIKEW